MNLTLQDLVDEMLSVENVEVKKKSFGNRIQSFLKRREIEKELQDEIAHQNALILKLGKESEEFLKSNYYKDIVEPHLRTTIKGGIQKLIREGETMTEVQLKSEIAVIKRTLTFIASMKLKVIQAEALKEKYAR